MEPKGLVLLAEEDLAAQMCHYNCIIMVNSKTGVGTCGGPRAFPWGDPTAPETGPTDTEEHRGQLEATADVQILTNTHI